MRERFSLPVVVLALTVAIVAGVAVMGFLGSAVRDHQPDLLAPATANALSQLGKLVFAVLAAGAVAGALGWCALFCLGRDGSHRMEWVAFLPYNYGGRSPFDTSDWTARK